MFEKEINNKIYIIGEPTLRQNKAFLQFCIDNGIQFEIDKTVDLSGLLTKIVQDDLIEELLAIMLQKKEAIWKPSCNDPELFSDLTETEIEEIFSEFFAKKKAWIKGLMNILQHYLQNLLTKLMKQSVLKNTTG